MGKVGGRLREGLGPIDAFCAGFPAGTVSGAPKIRAMEIIDDLEASRRGIYAGAVGYLDFAGNLDTCIAIRTLLFHRGEARVRARAEVGERERDADDGEEELLGIERDAEPAAREIEHPADHREDEQRLKREPDALPARAPRLRA